MATLFFDLETELIARGYAAPMPVTASWSHNGAAPELGLIAGFRPMFEAALADDTLIVNQNIAFDMSCMCTLDAKYLPAVFAKYARGEVQDIMINEKMLRFAVKGESDPFFGLGDLCDSYGLPPVNKSNPWRLEYASLRAIPVHRWPAGAREYALADADRPARIFAAQYALDATWKRHKGYHILHLAGEEAFKAFALNLIACKGLYTDPASTLELKRVLEAALATARAELQAAGIVRPDGSRDTKAAARMIEAACEAAGLPVKRTKTKQVAMGKEVLELIPDDLVTQYSIYSQAGTYVSRIEDMCQGFELPLQPRIDSLLETSRTSFSKPGDKSPLIGVTAQNFPQKILIGRGEKTPKHPRGTPLYAPVGARECLRPPPGFVFVISDLPTAELRSVSQQCIEWFGFSALADAINAGKDVHHMLGGQMAGIPYAEMIRRAEEAAIKDIRNQAKPGNFGFWGGMGPDSFVAYAWKQAHIMFSRDEAAALRDAWKASWPEHAAYFDRASRETKAGGTRRWYDKESGEWQEMQVALVRHPATGRYRNGCSFTQWCNTHFQERTATAAARGLCAVQHECFAVPRSPLYGSHVCAYVHDEIVLAAPEDQAPEAAVRLAEVMREKFNELHDHVPIKELDPVVARIYSKAAKPVKDATGRLTAWEPKKEMAA